MSRGSEVRQKTTKNWYQERSCDEAWCLVTSLQHNRQWAVEVFIYLSCYVFLLISIDQLTARQFITFIPHWTSCCTLKQASCPMLRKPSFTNYILQSSKVPFPISLLLYNALLMTCRAAWQKYFDWNKEMNKLKILNQTVELALLGRSIQNMTMNCGVTIMVN